MTHRYQQIHQSGSPRLGQNSWEINSQSENEGSEKARSEDPIQLAMTRATKASFTFDLLSFRRAERSGASPRAGSAAGDDTFESEDIMRLAPHRSCRP